MVLGDLGVYVILGNDYGFVRGSSWCIATKRILYCTSGLRNDSVAINILYRAYMQMNEKTRYSFI